MLNEFISNIRYKNSNKMNSEEIKNWLNDTSQVLELTNFNLTKWSDILKGKKHLITRLCMIKIN